MRGRREPQVAMLAFVDMEARIPADHPLRTIKTVADQALARLSTEFDAMYAEAGRPAIPPERLLKASLVIALYSVRSERAFCEELDYNLLFPWFLDLQLIEPSFEPTVPSARSMKRLPLSSPALVGGPFHRFPEAAKSRPQAPWVLRPSRRALTSRLAWQP